MRKAAFFLAAILPLGILSCQSGPRNAVLAYLTEAELQYEGEEQRETLRTAILDMLTADETVLRGKRYEDYSGQPDQWDLPTLLYRHVVPADSSRTLGNRFYRDIQAPEVRIIMKAMLEGLED